MAKDVITRLKVESSEYDSKIKRAQNGLLSLEQSLRAAGKTFNDADKQQEAFVRSLGQMQTVATTTKGTVAELTSAYTELSMMYKRMSDAEKNGAVGKALSSSLDQLKTRINTTKASLGEVTAELGDAKTQSLGFSDVLGVVGQKFGINTEMLGSLTTGTVAATAAIGAAAAAVAVATKAWADYNTELAKQTQITTVTTGLSGGSSDNMTSAARALSDVYGVDFREIINAANTLMTQFGESGYAAMQLISSGLQGMIEGDGPKLLSMVQQFAPAFRDAGVTASELVAVIQNSEGGLFTDQNMQAIVMGMRNIRLMTTATSGALAQLGIDGKKMTADLNAGTINVFDALKQVASQLQKVDSNSQTAGQVMQAVFGRAGTMSGTKLAEAIKTLNTDLTETKNQTGELGKATAQLAKQHEILEREVQKVFASSDWALLGKQLETEFTSELVTVVRGLGDFVNMLKDIHGWFNSIGESSPWAEIGIDIALIINPLTTVYGLFREITALASNPSVREFFGADVNKVQKTGYAYGKGDRKLDKKIPDATTDNTTPIVPITPTGGGRKGGKTTPPAQMLDIAPLQVAEWTGIPSMESLQKELSKYTKMQSSATDSKTYQTAIEGIARVQKEIDAQPLALKMGVDLDSAMQFKEQMDAMMGEIKPVELEVDVKGIKEAEAAFKATQQAAQITASVAGAIGQAFNAIEDPAAKVMGTIAQAIATIALSYAQAMSQAATLGPWAWVAFAATGLATMISSIAGIKSATAGSYEQGGIVPGTSWHGDQLTANVNSGELILSRSQQTNLASQLQGGGMQNVHLEAVVSGEQLRFVLNNNSRRRGKGEYVTTFMKY